ncbi:hypothetical protein NQ317_002773 [Molorchus minor]|uniref:Uncharacterized protein n=1 Tax=Molorchus minor TaxID=1323400 RepID=A0ABQ9JJE8_9CUCU|nr:hypothetical protein NQ317_002773 [Molorchus minor]
MCDTYAPKLGQSPTSESKLIEAHVSVGTATREILQEPPTLSWVHRTHIPITKVKTKPRTAIANQPKRVQFVTTEVRCQEKTRGGLRYEVILGEPEVKATPPKKQLSPKSSMSVQDIEEKLKAAEERRQQLESNKIAALSAKMQKIEEASRKKDEQTSQFITATRDALEQKMEHHTEKREAYITDLKTKLKDHIENVEKTRLTIEQQTDEVRTAIEEKLKTASIQRDENIKKMLERLKEHEDQVQKVRVQNTVKLQQLDSAIQEKLGQAQSRKEQLEQEQKEKLRNHNIRPIEIKQTVESTVEVRKTEVAALVETKLTIAEQKRELEIKKKLEAAKKHNLTKQTVRLKKVNQIESKLTAAEQKRELELQRKLEKAKENNSIKNFESRRKSELKRFVRTRRTLSQTR